MGFSFWLTALGFPVLLVLTSAVMRMLTGAKQTAFADIILAVIAFDFAVAVDRDIFARMVNESSIKDSLSAIYICYILIMLTLWLWCVKYVEPNTAAPDEMYLEDATELAVRYLWFFGGLFAVAVSVALALAPFAIRLESA